MLLTRWQQAPAHQWPQSRGRREGGPPHWRPCWLLRQTDIENGVWAWTSSLPRDTLVARLQAAGIPVAPMLSVEGQMEHPQFQACVIMRQRTHSYFGAERLFGLPWQMSATPPMLEQIDGLIAEGVAA